METLTFNENLLEEFKTFYPNCVYYDLTDENDAIILWDTFDDIIQILPFYQSNNRMFIYDQNIKYYIEL